MALLLAALLTVTAPDSAHSAWMVGTWGWQNPGEREDDCGSDHDATYYRNGRYDFLDESGTWRVEGDRLIETPIEAGLAGKPTIIRFVRIGRGVLRVTSPNPGKLIKCRAG